MELIYIAPVTMLWLLVYFEKLTVKAVMIVTYLQIYLNFRKRYYDQYLLNIDIGKNIIQYIFITYVTKSIFNKYWYRYINYTKRNKRIKGMTMYSA